MVNIFPALKDGDFHNRSLMFQAKLQNTAPLTTNPLTTNPLTPS